MADLPRPPARGATAAPVPVSRSSRRSSARSLCAPVEPGRTDRPLQVPRLGADEVPRLGAVSSQALSLQ